MASATRASVIRSLPPRMLRSAGVWCARDAASAPTATHMNRTAQRQRTRARANTPITIGTASWFGRYAAKGARGKMLGGPAPRRQRRPKACDHDILNMMKRWLLPLTTLALAVLVLVDRIGHLRAPDPAQATQGTAPAAAQPGELGTMTEARAARPPATPPVTAATPLTDRLARLAARQRLARAGEGTYLDSLLATTDSVVRRWPDRGSLPLNVAIVEGGVVGFEPRMAEFVREALDAWERADAGVRFAIIADTASADVVVRWIDRFEYDRAGQTDLTWDRLGR